MVLTKNAKKKQNLTEIKIQLLVRNFILQVNFTTDYHIYNLFHYLIAQLFSNKKEFYLYKICPIKQVRNLEEITVFQSKL